MGNKRYLGENAQSEEGFLRKTLSHNVIKIYWLHLLDTANWLNQIGKRCFETFSDYGQFDSNYLAKLLRPWPDH